MGAEKNSYAKFPSLLNTIPVKCTKARIYNVKTNEKLRETINNGYGELLLWYTSITVVDTWSIRWKIDFRNDDRMNTVTDFFFIKTKLE